MLDQSTAQSYSRSSRLARKVSENKSHQEASRRTKVPQPHKLYLLILSVVISCLSVSMPVFTDMANSVPISKPLHWFNVY
ncbi:hypothetical protein [Streptococcus gallolyticus]|uniref:hypothetical protein n=1 Tax=Streptococcus gallolyticus TaxID=315405 RepID=UPI000B246FE8|nr:hypothetical protein [Streptococcus gallolyticus]